MIDPITGEPIVAKLPGAGLIEKGFKLLQGGTGDPFYGVSSVFIRQEADPCEVICPFLAEQANFYRITSTDDFGLFQKQELGSIIETSQCFQRFLCQQWRPFKQTFLTPENKPLFEMKRDYRIPGIFCLPCKRPELRVEIGNQIVGYVNNPYEPLGRNVRCPCPELVELDILDSRGQIIYRITSDFCQQNNLGRRLCCPFRAHIACRNIRFEILDIQNSKVGSITNMFKVSLYPRYNGCVNEIISKADTFLINFPSDATFVDKTLILAAAITIDFDQFESTCCNQA